MTTPVNGRILLLGATGTVGRAVLSELLRHNFDVVCFLRPGASVAGTVSTRFGNVGDPASLENDGFRGERFDVVISCMASRTGLPRDAWAVDHDAHVNLLDASKRHGVSQFILLSAICVQKPLLAFQHAKLAFEGRLKVSGLTYSIVRPTAYFKSLSGQVARVKAGKPFLLFGDGGLTSCKPISDGDLARYIVGCIGDTSRHNAVLPIGGPGPAMTTRQQGEQLFALLGMPPRFRKVPVAMMDAIIGGLSFVSWFSPRLGDKAELAKIGRYYATESMLVLDPGTGRYDADLTPSFGQETLASYHARLIAGTETLDLGAHAVFRQE